MSVAPNHYLVTAIQSTRDTLDKLEQFRRAEWEDDEGVDERVWRAKAALEHAQHALDELYKARTTLYGA